MAMIESLTNNWPGELWPAFNRYLNIPVESPNIAIVHKYKYSKVLRFIANEGEGRAVPIFPYDTKFLDR